jgi:hypothetical protein
VQGSDNRAYSVDFLLERKVLGGGAVTFEAEWAGTTISAATASPTA